MPRSPRIRSVAAAIALALAAALSFATGASASDSSAGTTVARTWSTDGHVGAILVSGGLVYIGGSFNTVSDPAGNNYPVPNLAVYNPATQSFLTSWHPAPNGVVNAMTVSGGTLYLGGSFTKVGTVARTNLAAVSLSSGAPTSWAPQVNNVVYAMAVGIIGRVYVGGAFTRLTDGTGIHTGRYLVRVSSTNGALDTSWLPAPNERVYALARSADGAQLYVGGNFTTVNGSSAGYHLADISSSAGAKLVSGFVPGMYGAAIRPRPPVLGLALDGSRVLVGTGGLGGYCSSVSATTGAVGWVNSANGNVQAVGVLNGTVYCGGHFNDTNAMAGQTRYKLALVSESTGALLSYAPRINSALGVWALAPYNNRMYAGGDFTALGAVEQGHLGVLFPPGTQAPPAAVQRLTVRASEQSARVYWDQPVTDNGSAITSYTISRSDGGGAFALVGTTTSTTWDDGGLADGTTYAYQVAAVSAIGTGPALTSQAVVPAAASPILPTAPRALSADGSSGSVALRWSAPADDGGSPVTSYVLMRGTSSGTEVALTTLDAATTTYTDSAVTPSSRYYYRVAANTAVGRGPASTEAITTAAFILPGAPVVSGAPSGTAVKLSWTVPSPGSSPITRYLVLRGGLQYATVNAPATTYTDAAVTAGTTYTYQVRAINSYGSGRQSNAVKVSAAR